jgi:hypothetical protein
MAIKWQATDYPALHKYLSKTLPDSMFSEAFYKLIEKHALLDATSFDRAVGSGVGPGVAVNDYGNDYIVSAAGKSGIICSTYLLGDLENENAVTAGSKVGPLQRDGVLVDKFEAWMISGIVIWGNKNLSPKELTTFEINQKVQALCKAVYGTKFPTVLVIKPKKVSAD